MTNKIGFLMLIALIAIGCNSNSKKDTKQIDNSKQMKKLDIDNKLTDYKSGKITYKVFINEFLNSDVFVCLPKGQVDKSNGTIKQNPTFFTIKYSDYMSLCFYTSESNAELTFKQYPEFEEVAEVNVTDLLNILKLNKFGIIINPYCSNSHEFSLSETEKIIQLAIDKIEKQNKK